MTKHRKKNRHSESGGGGIPWHKGSGCGQPFLICGMGSGHRGRSRMTKGVRGPLPWYMVLWEALRVHGASGLGNVVMQSIHCPAHSPCTRACDVVHLLLPLTRAVAFDNKNPPQPSKNQRLPSIDRKHPKGTKNTCHAHALMCLPWPQKHVKGIHCVILRMSQVQGVSRVGSSTSGHRHRHGVQHTKAFAHCSLKATWVVGGLL